MSDDVKLYWMFAMIGSIPVAVALSRSAAWGVQATSGAAMVVWALSALARITLRRVRHPGTGAPR